MDVDVIDTYDGFVKLRRDWDAVYVADPEAQFFLSWTWLAEIFRRRDSGWCVLAARAGRPGGDYVAFLPLRLNGRLGADHRALKIEMAGEYSWADYTGFISHPEHEARAIPRLAARLKQLRWSKLDLRHLRVSDCRLHLFTDSFEGDNFVQERREEGLREDGTDSEVCPYVDLPDDFETYLKERLSANTRQKLRRLLRQVDGAGDLRITHSVPETFDRDLHILAGFWRTKWAPRKGEEVDHLAAKYREIVGQGLEAGFAHVPVLWKGNAPLAALGTFIDRQKKVLLYFVGARDSSCDDPPPGLVLHAHTIRWAIENGIRTYDFLRGNERFKYSFGASERRIRSIVIRNRTGHIRPDTVGPTARTGT
jgi:CelD/BcsL family acetyltransferase involved in cellulose biosynthesis